jgi:maltooligosyltrehalose trehalohydrolase
VTGFVSADRRRGGAVPGVLWVWAPRVTAASAVVGGVDTPMVRHNDGWWSTADPVGQGVDYRFRLDGGDPLPDPRSRRQPFGVHGPSRTFDPAAHLWTDGAWTGRQLAGAVIYELHLGTFTPGGTLEAAIERLDHVVHLGVDFVELLPVNAFNGVHNWGYDGVLWYAVHEAYGGPGAYQRFVDACHDRGLGVIQDVVYNHLGASGNYLPEFGPYLHAQSANAWGASVNLDGPDSDAVRGYIIDNALMWLSDYHVDGLRLDAVHALVDRRAVHLLEELASQVDALSAHLGRPLTLIAESDLNDPRLYTPRQAGGYGLTAAWNDDFHHVVHVALTGEKAGYYCDFGSMSAIAKVVTGGYFHDGTYSTFRGRCHGRPIDARTTEAWRLVAFSQDHDQIGNRAAGDRLSGILKRDDLAIAAVLTLTSPFTPMLFMGEEWAASTPWQFFTSHPEPELGEATARGRHEEFARMGWDPSLVPDPQDPQTFIRSKLDWSEVDDTDHAAMLGLFRELLRLRRSQPDLTDPRLYRTDAWCDDDQHWLVMTRGSVRVAVNLSGERRRLPLRAATPTTSWTLLLRTVPDVAVTADAVDMPPHAAAVLAPMD